MRERQARWVGHQATMAESPGVVASFGGSLSDLRSVFVLRVQVQLPECRNTMKVGFPKRLHAES
jgi:hypothetical protein